MRMDLLELATLPQVSRAKEERRLTSAGFQGKQ
jgi:hypothetical protein